MLLVFLALFALQTALSASKGVASQATFPLISVSCNHQQLPTAPLPLVMLKVLSPLATKSYSATKRLGSFSLGPARRFSLEFQRAASLRPWGSKSELLASEGLLEEKEKKQGKKFHYQEQSLCFQRNTFLVYFYFLTSVHTTY